MKNRVILSFVMASGLALGAAPVAHATNLPECGHSYAFQVHGAEPSTINDAALHYIAGIGQITFGPLNSDGRCAVTHLETIYNDNDVLGFSAGPSHCFDVLSVLGTGFPCFDGGDHQAVGGLLSPSPNGNGATNLTIDPSFGWVNGVVTASSLPLSFTLQAAIGASTVIGTSIAPPGPTLPAGSPPANPVLTITMQKQSTGVTLPVTGPNAIGIPPFLGLFVLSFDRFGAPSADSYALPVTGSFGSAAGVLQIFGNASGGGSLSFNTNANVDSATAENDCDFAYDVDDDFADGTTFSFMGFASPPYAATPKCGNEAADAGIALGGVLWGATDTNSYLIEIGDGAGFSLPLGLGSPAGEVVTGTMYASAPAGQVTNLVQQTLVAPKKTSAGYVKTTDTSPAACDLNETMTPVADGICTLNLVSFPGGTPEPVNAIAESDTPSTQYAQTNCSCTTSSASSADSVSSTLTISTSLCQFSGTGTAIPSTTSYTITCKN
jgi:hypothetical protein